MVTSETNGEAGNYGRVLDHSSLYLSMYAHIYYENNERDFYIYTLCTQRNREGRKSHIFIPLTLTENTRSGLITRYFVSKHLLDD